MDGSRSSRIVDGSRSSVVIPESRNRVLAQMAALHLDVIQY